MTKIIPLSILVLFVSTCHCFAATAKTKQPAKPAVAVQPKPTKEVVIGLAAKHIKASEPKLDSAGKQIIQDIRSKLDTSKGQESAMDRTVDGLVDYLTLQLASLKDADVLTVASAALVQTRPSSPRTTNLFGSVLHTRGKIDDAVSVLEYTLSLSPKSQLAKLNLANAYIDLKRWDEAKKLADQVVFEDSECRPAHRVLATYWYHKNNLGLFREELLKAAKFKGFVRKKTEKKQQKVQEQEVKEGDSTGTLEQKVRSLEDDTPMTTADIVEDEYPDAARKIRDRYGKLAPDEQFLLPKIPTCNLNGPKEYKENEPIVDEWLKVCESRFKKVSASEAARMGIDVNASKKVQEAQTKAAAEKEIAKALQQAQDAMKWAQNANLKGMTPAQKAKMEQAAKQMQQMAKQQGVKLEDKPVDVSEIPGFDKGGPLVITNYQNYQAIVRTYEIYFMQYNREFQAKVVDIYKVYEQKIQEENDQHAQIWDRLQVEHNAENNPHGEEDIPCRQEMLRHKKMLNSISHNYYRQWADLYFPQYVQKMKPTIDAYYKVCMLYVKNMNDPEVMKRECSRIRRNHVIYSSMAVSGIGGGSGFKYYGETYEEELAIDAAIARAREEAEAKKPQFEREFPEPEFDLSKWLEDHLVLEVSGEFLALKLTAKSIEFEAWAMGPGAGIKYDWSENTLETYTGVGAKLEVGVNVAGMELKAEVKGDFARKTARWDFTNGTYTESYEAKGEAKAGAGFVSVSGEVSVNTQLEAKTSSKVTFGDTVTLQDEAEFK